MKQGFTLLELLLSIAIGCFVFMIGAHYIQLLYNYSKTIRGKCEDTITLAHAVSLIHHYGEPAWSALSTWHRQDNHELIWQTNHKSYGLLYKKNVLFLYEGTYDQKNHQWLTKIKSTLLKQVKHASFDLIEREGMVKGFAYRIVKNKETSKGFVRSAGHLIISI